MSKHMVGKLLMANLTLFVAQSMYGDELLRWLGLWPLGLFGLDSTNMLAPSFMPWQVVSYAFLHGGLLHLGLNMYALWMFGRQLEAVWGPYRFAAYYFACVVGAALTQLVVSEYVLLQGGSAYPVIGASGGVFGLLLAFALLFPRARLMLLFPPIAVEVRWFVLGYAALELYFGVTGTSEGVAHFAHLGGMFTGWLLLRHRRRRF
ncbi:MAG: rhomboid family intramembrane serine protease [Thiobacillus sp.]|nr:rhomboid family intramembrane serine protease [Thiobacillus sp.]